MSPVLASQPSTEASAGASLLSVGHAVPPHRMLQSDAAAAARRIFAHRYAAFERMAPVFETAGIRTRHTVKPIDWYLSDLGWPPISTARKNSSLRRRAARSPMRAARRATLTPS